MSTSLSPLLAPLFSSAAMRAVCDDASYLQRMLDFEAALARAEAAAGIIPSSAAGPIGKACDADAGDIAALAQSATQSVNLPTPLVTTLTTAGPTIHADAERYVHSDPTGQDVLDTWA